MAYIRYKEVTRRFNFSKAIDLDKVPSYCMDYIYGEEELLAAYRVGSDHGVITTNKIIIFDNSQQMGMKKEITTVPYHAITAHSIVFRLNSAEIYLLLGTGNPLVLKFSNMKDKDKSRLRHLYNAMSAAICDQLIPKEIIDKLVRDDFEFKDR